MIQSVALALLLIGFAEVFAESETVTCERAESSTSCKFDKAKIGCGSEIKVTSYVFCSNCGIQPVSGNASNPVFKWNELLPIHNATTNCRKNAENCNCTFTVSLLKLGATQCKLVGKNNDLPRTCLSESWKSMTCEFDGVTEVTCDRCEDKTVYCGIGSNKQLRCLGIKGNFGDIVEVSCTNEKLGPCNGCSMNALPRSSEKCKFDRNQTICTVEKDNEACKFEGKGRVPCRACGSYSADCENKDKEKQIVCEVNPPVLGAIESAEFVCNQLASTKTCKDCNLRIDRRVPMDCWFDDNRDTCTVSRAVAYKLCRGPTKFPANVTCSPGCGDSNAEYTAECSHNGQEILCTTKPTITAMINSAELECIVDDEDSCKECTLIVKSSAWMLQPGLTAILLPLLVLVTYAR